ncbi:MAG TPA: ribose-5-phosphate isomerase RpiA [Pseudorhodoplanes sp.]|nr:ribose-5-phosphate isomerase RpiA [Pseudorhodoplanes sp.]
MDIEGQKRLAAARALDWVRDGMRLGLGTGSTARHFVDLLGEKVRAGLDVVGVPTSEATRVQAASLGIRLTTLDETPELDLTVDGADEVAASDLSLIKGGGGALLREKIVAAASGHMLVIADESKWVATLGRFPLPVEVVPFGFGATLRALQKALGLADRDRLVLRRDKSGHPFVTDGGHWIVDAALGHIADPTLLAGRLSSIPGVVEHGLFIGMAKTVIIAGADGVRVAERSQITSSKGSRP